MLLRLQLIGRMQALTLNNESVLPLGRKTRGLLAILALSGRRPVLRSKLAELLWSRRSEEQARASLRQEIHRLLEALSPVGVEIITVERHTLALKPALTSVDAERIRNANANQAESLPPIDGILLDELTGTDPAFDAWLDQERNRLREHAIGLFETMLRRQRDTMGTLAAARQLLLLDPLHEAAWRAQIRGQLALGETGLAFQSAERCAAAFAARNAVEPGPDTRRLLSEMLRGGPEAVGRVEADPGSQDGSGRTGAGASADAAEASATEQHDAPAAFPPGLDAAPERMLRHPDAVNQLRHDIHHGLPFITVLPMLDLNGPATSGRFEHAGAQGTQAPQPPKLTPGTSPNLAPGLAPALAQGLAEDIGAGLIHYGGVKLLSGSELSGSLSQGRDDAVLRQSFGLDYVLDGTLQRTQNRIRAILRMTDIRQHGQLVWAQRFDAAEDDVLTLQETITAQVMARLPWEIILVEGRRLSHRPTAELNAYGLVMRAVTLILRIDRLQNERACALLQEASALDPGHPLPHMMLGLACMLRSMQRWGDPKQAAAEASAALGQALERGSSASPGALTLSGLLRSELHDEPDSAMVLIERAMADYPFDAAGWAAAAFPLVRLGRIEEAARHFQHYKMLFPTHPLEVLLDQPGIMIALLQGSFDEAVRMGGVLSELRPGFVPNLVPYLSALGHLGRAAEAERITVRLQTMLPDGGTLRLVQESGLRRAEDRQCLADGLRRAGLPLEDEPAPSGPPPPSKQDADILAAPTIAGSTATLPGERAAAQKQMPSDAGGRLARRDEQDR
ncbi:BTAD domain-containing putative transcriptional regulator [Lichenicola sp.]|uniref:BTAD domain-containing putative transcriptional regulator n=1 Tax=Lichenicola sp. TaxID=2804529 RepID=UPI003B00419D